TRFARLATKLETLRETGDFEIFDEDEVDPRRCLRCGLALGFVGDVCPRCINRGAVLGRVWGLLQPYRRAASVMCVLIVLGVVAELVPPKLQQYLVDHVLRAGELEGRADNLLAVLLVIVGSLACTRLVL